MWLSGCCFQPKWTLSHWTQWECNWSTCEKQMSQRVAFSRVYFSRSELWCLRTVTHCFRDLHINIKIIIFHLYCELIAWKNASNATWNILTCPRSSCGTGRCDRRPKVPKTSLGTQYLGIVSLICTDNGCSQWRWHPFTGWNVGDHLKALFWFFL